jgi:hypothetical protein
MSTERNERETTNEDTDTQPTERTHGEARHEENGNSLGAELAEFGNAEALAHEERLENQVEFSGHYQETEPSEVHPIVVQVSVNQSVTVSFVPDVATQEVSVREGHSEVRPSEHHDISQEHSRSH